MRDWETLNRFLHGALPVIIEHLKSNSNASRQNPLQMQLNSQLLSLEHLNEDIVSYTPKS
jgi:hypothetical protein